MGTIAVTNWTGKLLGAEGTDYRLLSAGDQFTGVWNEHSADAATRHLYHCNEGAGNLADDGTQGLELTWGTSEGWETAAPWLGAAGLDLAGSKWLLTAESPALTIAAADSCTISCWAKATVTTSAKVLWAVQDTWPGSLVMNYGNVAGRVASYWLFDGAQKVTWANDAVTDADWHHYRLRKTSTYFAVDVDGAEVTRYTGAADDMSIDAIILGRQYNVATRFWGNEIDECRLQMEEDTSAPHRFEADSIRTAAATVDAGETVAWTQLVTTCPAFTSDEDYDVYVFASDSSSVPAVGSGDWVLAATGQTGGATIDLSGLGLANGQYCHTEFVVHPDTGALQQYIAAIDEATWTYTPSDILPYRFTTKTLPPRFTSETLPRRFTSRTLPPRFRSETL